MTAIRRIALLGNDPADRQWSILSYGEQLLRALAALSPGTEIVLVAPDTERSGRILRRCRPGRALATYASRYFAYPAALRGVSADICHILEHGNSHLIHRLDARRTVITCHDLMPLLLRHKTRSLAPWLSNWSFGNAVRSMERAAAVVTNSEHTRNDVLAMTGCRPGRVFVTPLGIDPAFRPAASEEETRRIRAALGLPPGMLVLHVGQNAFYKNIETVLAALRILRGRGEPAWLVRAGAPLTRSQRLSARRAGVERYLIERGPTDVAGLVQLYQSCDVFAFPSWYEGLGLPPLEALACGLPVVASNRGALPETLGGAGTLVDPESPEQLADALAKLGSGRPPLRGLIEKGIQRASEFSWKRCAERTLAAYRTVMGG